MLAFIAAGKPVLVAEYTDVDGDFDIHCDWVSKNKIDFNLKNRILSAIRVTCH